MRLHHAALIALLITPVLVTAQENLGTYEDRIAVEDVMARYVWAVDSLDADGYVAVFTEDAVIDSNGTISKGHEEIRKVVTNLIKRRDDNKAKGLPTSNLYHVISNVRITFPKANEAVHQSYWQTVRRDNDGKMICGRDGPLRRPSRQAQRQVADSVAQADRFHRLIRCPCRRHQAAFIPARTTLLAGLAHSRPRDS